MISLPDRLKELRKSKKLTQTELGKILGVGKTTISMYETNNRVFVMNTYIFIYCNGVI